MVTSIKILKDGNQACMRQGNKRAIEMLYAIWFSVLTIGAWYCSYRSFTNEENENYIFGSLSASVMAIILSWELIGKTYFIWLTEFVPQTPDDIQLFTIYFILGISCIALIFAPLLLPFLFMNDDGKIHYKNFRLLKKHKLTVVE
jgi:hypothetical protein